MSTNDYAPTRHYLKHQKVSPKQYATDTWLNRQSMLEPCTYAELFYTWLGIAMCSASAAFVIWLSFKLWSAVAY